ncbi:acetyl-CoA hydrolase/transferase C-terminal domain-containing protein [Oleiagrimonas soli]|uniref:Acetyl-CoA hydrolase n=1 Tax=Oleiagrimonas soli TaxID=1543381 RepID=A0A099CUT5_9GAMM|nr:acetyl-CoA hydrolase/transferase C-terminal domain-containing protein [Oleiagrimonas soli]KGI77441.1 acetyl-CoA hydrolase [Oleiagrimonas soli]MBB6183114.1 acyl-CoA hydrolase [Oleiagrimonas soli]
MTQPETVEAVDVCVERILQRCGAALRVATPLGLGKPNGLLNALYRHAQRESNFSLTLFTALSLTRPAAGEGLQARFLKPFLSRHFGDDYVDPAYAVDMRRGRLPGNVRVHEFYLQSGAYLQADGVQRDYISQNYTHVARDLVKRDINLIVQLVAVRKSGDGVRISLGSNPDVTLDLLDRLEAAGLPRPMLVAVEHPDMPFTGGGAEVSASMFDVLLREAAPQPRLFALPREPVDDTEYAIGLHASGLVRDGGTLQIGIGSLSDALVHALTLRQRENARYRAMHEALDPHGAHHALAQELGGLAPFSFGLYGASEMVMDGFMHLHRAGILGRRTYDDMALEQAVADGRIASPLPAHAAETLYATGVLPETVDAKQMARLKRFGLLPEEAALRTDEIACPDGRRLPCRLDSAQARAAWSAMLEGRALRDGRYLRGAFFLGSHDFYTWLRELDGEDWSGLDMTRVSDVNQLYGGRERLDALQRRDARFFNICMMATPLGAVVSDALEDGRVVSGVGGQYNFVAMAHALDDGRSALMLRSTRTAHGRVHSNIRWNYGHTTIPRHLRDLVITEYGVADLRGRSDEDCVRAMLAISDARFVDGLVAEAQDAGKLPGDFRVPDAWRANTPEHLRAALQPFHADGLLPTFPLGSDFTEVEQRLLPALGWLRDHAEGWGRRLRLLAALLAPGKAVAGETEALQRMGFGPVRGIGERLQRRLLRTALRRGGRDSVSGTE